MKIKHSVSYAKARAISYPSVEDQLDMIWHGMNCSLLDKVEPFYSSILAVKEKYPKEPIGDFSRE
ncbi:hypothetical protein [Pseudomonas sp. QD4]|uniref:hypothetical protein n=1 Tax=Pseudomonas sp. QD4 TaxID=3368618 RepID=UPI003BA34118